MQQFRWVTKVLAGTWQGSQDAALHDAVVFGQAVASASSDDVIRLRPFTVIETRSDQPD